MSFSFDICGSEVIFSAKVKLFVLKRICKFQPDMFRMGQANTAWKQQNHMSKTIYEQMGVFQHEVSFFDPKMVTLKGKKVTSFSDIPKQEKNMFCNNGNG